MRTISDYESHLTTLEQTIHDAVAEPLLWTRVTDDARAVIGASASSLVVRRKSDLVIVDPIAATWDERAGLDYLNHFHTEDVVIPKLGTVPTGSPFILEELLDIQLFRRTAFFNEWADKHGVAFFAAITFEIDKEHIGALSFHRPTAQLQFGEEEREFIRRMAVPLRFALGQRKLTMELQLARGSLDRLSIGVVHLDDRGRIAWCNSRAEEFLREGDGLAVKNRQLRATRDDVAGELEAMIYEALQGDASPRGEDIIIPRSSGKAPFHVVLVPLSRAYSVSALGDYVPTAIFINDMEDDDGYDAALQHMLTLVFKLTKIQAEIACRLVEGAKYKEMVTPQRNEETIRSHIKAIYAKTGVNSRAQLQKLARQMVMQLRLRKSGRRRQR